MNPSVLHFAMQRRSVVLGLVVVGGLAWPPSVTADDGVLEIDQSCVAAGCFPGDTAGFPVQITAPGSYLLTSNLVVPDNSTTGVAISGDDVVLDLGGFEVSGPVVCPATAGAFECTGGGVGAGIRAEGPNAVGIVVRNGSVRGFGGIPELGAGCIVVLGRGVIEDVVVRSCEGNGIGITHGTVRRAVAVASGLGILAELGMVTDSHVQFSGSGIFVGRGSVLDSVVIEVGGDGINVLEGPVSRNEVSSAGVAFQSSGISCTNCSVNRNQVINVNGVGIRTSGSATLIGNTVVGSTSFGITANGSAGYGLNNLHDNNNGMAQVGGAGSLFQIDTNVCHGDTTCP
jgi:hypothetical protein